MIQHKTHIAAVSATAIMILCAPMGAAFAQDSQTDLVVSQSDVVLVTPDQDLVDADLNITGEDIRNLPNLNLDADIETPAEDYADTIKPVVELDESSNVDFTVGMIGVNNDTDRRDPYSVEDVKISPVYPEGRYVDTMDASAGLDVKTEF